MFLLLTFGAALLRGVTVTGKEIGVPSQRHSQQSWDLVFFHLFSKGVSIHH